MRRAITAVMVLGLGMVPVAGHAAEDVAPRTVESAKEAVKETVKTTAREVGDSLVTLKIKLALFADERVSSRDVHVATRDGVVALRGKVGSETARQASEEIALKIDGAKRVHNQLMVVPEATRKIVDRKDDQIASDVEKRLKDDPRLKQADIDVRADNGLVTLTGQAPSLETSVRASETAYRVPGVRAVRNELTLQRKG